LSSLTNYSEITCAAFSVSQYLFVAQFTMNEENLQIAIFTIITAVS